MTQSWPRWQQKLSQSGIELDARWEALRKELFKQRRLRPAPLKDDKVLTDWNGLMVAALATGARVLGDEHYAAAAQKTIGFIQSRLKDAQGRLMHRFRDGQAAVAAQAADFVYLIMGMIELYRATSQTDLLEGALALQAELDARFWDSGYGGYFSIAAEANDLPVRPKELHDGAMPSVNSVALSNLLFLGRLTGDSRWDVRAHELSQAFASVVVRQPMAYTHFLNGLDMALGTGQFETTP